MPLEKCRECGHEVAKSAKACPNCGVKEPGKSVWTRQSGGGCAFIILIVLAFVIVSVIVDSGDAPGPAIFTNQGVSLVRVTITEVDASSFSFREGPLEGGTAVLVEGTAAFWVKDGIVFAANGTAKTWSPTVEYSPTGIGFLEVQASVR